ERQVVEVSIRVAGSKWSNVEMTLYEDDIPIGFIEVERWPGSPDANPSYGAPTMPIMFDSTKTYRAVVTYDPYPDSGDMIEGDQPNNGKDKKDNAGNPVWVMLTTENRTTTMIHHTFNTQQSKIRNSDHWNHVEPWEVELNDYLGGISVLLTGTAYDPGADDLSFLWEFDDGTVISSDYPNPGGVFPVSITDTVDYSGPATGVTLTVTDDDGGSNYTTIAF
ncbi:MAG: PKD domain-containing protein, partial [Thermoplasmata archaeon]